MKHYFIKFLISLLLINFSITNENILNNNNEKCLVLALQGGGDHGAYQAGAMKGLIDNLPGSDVEWDVITGISAGTLNGAGFSLFKQGDEKEAIKFVITIWRMIEDKNHIYKNWWPLLGDVLSAALAITKKSSIWDTTPERELITAVLKDREIVRELWIGVDNIKTGKYEVYDANTLTREQLINSIMSSSAVPVVFPAINFLNNDLYADGGVKHGVDVITGINSCKNKGFEEKNIVVDIIKCSRKNFDEQKPENLHTLNALMRTFDIIMKSRGDREVHDVVKSFPNINFRYIVEPTKPLPNSTLPLIFDKEATEFMLTVGEEDAINIIKKESEFLTESDKKEYIKNKFSDNFVKELLNPKRAIPNDY